MKEDEIVCTYLNGCAGEAYPITTFEEAELDSTDAYIRRKHLQDADARGVAQHLEQLRCPLQFQGARHMLAELIQRQTAVVAVFRAKFLMLRKILLFHGFLQTFEQILICSSLKSLPSLEGIISFAYDI